MKKGLTFILLIGLSFLGKAQFSTPNNYIKTNLTSVVFNNYSFQYERTFARNFSLSLSYRFMPTTNLPFKNEVSKLFHNHREKEFVKNLQVDNYALTPELRFYLRRGGKGFYVSAYYRYADFGLEKYTVFYDKIDGSQGQVDLSGNFKINSGGIMIGAQWVLARTIVLDWWIAGVNFGSVTGTIQGHSSDDLSVLEQNDVKKAIENFKYLDKVTVTDKNNVKVDFSGPWTGIRMGLSIGICF